ncbi:MAG: tRNA (guanosine(37)-N1)-methyltransferase TrmD, partial [Pseudomonadota bacterium]|nr:tRNA (guanosine(37)-N1)-methyltransferase TrmD [Pseudomonadota bacterium]
MLKELNFISIFPEIFSALSYGVIGRFIENQHVTCRTWNPRDYASNEGGFVDDKPYGGGPGMVMQAGPLAAALEAQNSISESKHNDDVKSKVVMLSPTGKVLNHSILRELLEYDKLTFVCGRYEGVDQRFIDTHVDMELSIGDYVLSGGEFAALVVTDALIRLLPGCLGNSESWQQDSFSSKLLDHEHYTRPEYFSGLKCPEVLLGGDHKKIAEWRLQQALGKTW